MRWLTRSTLVLILSVLCVSMQAADKPPFTLTISGLTSVIVGDEISVEAELKNTSGRPVNVVWGLPYVVIVHDADGKTVSKKQGQLGYWGVSVNDPLQPGQTSGQKVVISGKVGEYDLSRPGRYVVQLQRTMDDDGHPKGIVVNSNRLTITVLPNSEVTRRVAEIMNRALARDYRVVDGWNAEGKPVRGIMRISWVPPTTQDYADIAGLGESAIPALAAYVKPGANPGGFVQAIAVKFLGSIGGAPTIAPLGEALDARDWEVARLYALDILGKMPEPEATSLLRSVLGDSDPLVSDQAKHILSLRKE